MKVFLLDKDLIADFAFNCSTALIYCGRIYTTFKVLTKAIHI